MEFHPISTIFPMMEEKDFNDLVADIAKYGQREIIIVYENKILDGRNRFMACEKLKRTPRIRELNCNDGDPIDFVLSANLQRRHLKPQQRAMAIVAANELRSDSGGRPKTSSIEEVSKPLSRQQAAKLADTSITMIERAKFVSTKGTEEEKEAVRSGKKAIWGVFSDVKARNTPLPRGARITPPNNLTVEQWVRKGLELEEDGASADDAAEQIKLGIQSYRKIKDVVLLSDMTDLSRAEKTIVDDTLNYINTERQVNIPNEVKNIVLRVYGNKRRTKDAKNALSRTEQFLAGVDVIYHICTQEREIPQLDSDQVNFVSDNLKEAVGGLNRLIKKVKEIYGE